MDTIALTIICSLAAALLALIAALSLRSGRILWYPAMLQIDRDEQPGLFWVLVVAQILGAGVFGWLALS